MPFEQAMAIPGFGDFSPADVADLIGWWDAEHIASTTATDRSGNGNHATIAGGMTPAASAFLNRRMSLTIGTGSGGDNTKYLTANAIGALLKSNEAFTVFSVMYSASGATRMAPWALRHGTGSSYHYPLRWDADNRWALQRKDAAANVDDDFAGARTAIPDTGAFTFVDVCEGGDGIADVIFRAYSQDVKMRGFIRGSTAATANPEDRFDSAVGSATAGATTFWIGGRLNGATSAFTWDGEWASTLVYRRALTAAEINRVGRYLQRYGTTWSPVYDHRVIVWGDSLATDGYWVNVASIDITYDGAVGGNTIEDTITDENAYNQSALSYDVAVIQAGINNLNAATGSGQTSDQMATQLDALVNDVVNDRSKKAVYVGLGRQQDDILDAAEKVKFAEYNATIVAAIQNGVTAKMPFAAAAAAAGNLNMYDALNDSGFNATDYLHTISVANIHYTAAGSAYVGRKVAARVNAIA